MATAHGQPPAHLKDQLLSEGHRFAFFQAARLLSRLTSGGLKIRPHVSSGFPASDVLKIEEGSFPESFVMTATFLGLYGVSSPLPAFYTEEILRDESAAMRDFLDIFHQRLYELLFEIWKKYRLVIQIVEARSQAPLDMLYAICGLPGADSYSYLRYAGLLGGRPRSALGLETMLTDYLDGTPVEIVPFVSRTVRIPRDQQLCLGPGLNRLGQDSFIGEECQDRQGKFRVRIGPLNAFQFRALLQGGQDHPAMVELVNHYLTDSLDYDFELILNGVENRPIVLGGSDWARLGLDTTLVTSNYTSDLRVVFPPATPDQKEAA